MDTATHRYVGRVRPDWRGRPCVVLRTWRGRGPHNALVRFTDDGHETICPMRCLRKEPNMVTRQGPVKSKRAGTGGSDARIRNDAARMRRRLDRRATQLGAAARPRCPLPCFQVYKDDAGEWRWRFLARNGQLMADSGEGYKRRGSAVGAATRLVMLCRGELNADTGTGHTAWFNSTYDGKGK